MSYEFITEVTKGYLHVKVLGKDSLEVSTEYWTRIFELSQKEGHKKVLVEEELEGTLTTLDSYKISSLISELGKKFKLKIAFYDKLPEHNINNTFGETVAITRGVTVKVFPSFIKAEKWLLDS